MADVASRGELQLGTGLDEDLVKDLQRWQFRSRVFFGRSSLGVFFFFLCVFVCFCVGAFVFCFGFGLFLFLFCFWVVFSSSFGSLMASKV